MRIIYARSPMAIEGILNTDPVTYSTVGKDVYGDNTVYTLQDQNGNTFCILEGEIDALIAALVQARGAVDSVTGKVA